MIPLCVVHCLLFVCLHFLLTLTQDRALAVATSNRSTFYRLHAEVFEGYSPNIRPVYNVTRATEVELHVHIKSIVDIDVKLQRLYQILYLDAQWMDEFLTWDPEIYDGVTNFLVKQKDIWIPDLMFGPHLSGQSLQLGHSDMLLMVWHDGRVSWTPDLTIETSCAMDITNYPFDEQRCTWRMYPWMSDNEHVRLKVRSLNDVLDILVSENAEWDLRDVTTQKCDFQTEYFRFSCIGFTYVLKRRSTFLILTIVVPTVMLAIMSPMAFALPVQAGEKVSLSVAPSLAFVVLLSIMIKVLPQSSLQTSVFVVYLVILVVSSTLFVILTVFVVSLYHRPECSPLSLFAVRFVTIIRFFTNSIWSGGKIRKHDVPLQRRGSVKARNAARSNYIAEVVLHSEPSPFKETVSSNIGEDDFRNSDVGSDITAALENDVRDSKQISHESLHCSCRGPDAEVTWRDFAAALDLVFFWLFFVFVLFVSIGCFVTMDKGVWSL